LLDVDPGNTILGKVVFWMAFRMLPLPFFENILLQSQCLATPAQLPKDVRFATGRNDCDLVRSVEVVPDVSEQPQRFLVDGQYLIFPV
jgi:hypothetical protein